MEEGSQEVEAIEIRDEVQDREMTEMRELRQGGRGVGVSTAKKNES